MKVTQIGKSIKLSAETDDDKRTLTNMLQKFVSKPLASTPEKPKPYYTELDEAVKFIGYPIYVVRSKDGSRYYQSDAAASEYIAELKDKGEMYVYLLYKSPTDVQ